MSATVDAAGVEPAYYPVFLDLRGRACLVVGGGPIAVGKVQGFLAAGARVTVVAPDADAAIRAWHDEARVAWVRRTFRDRDVEGAFVVVAATDDRQVNAFVYRLADRAGCLANAVDDLDHCNFIAPAVARAGAVQVAVSTSGHSPALAKRVRDRVAREVLSPAVAALAAFLGAWRPRVKGAIDGYARRQAFWERVLDGRIPALVSAGDLARAEAVMGECLRRASGPVAAPTPSSLGPARADPAPADPARPAPCAAARGAAA